MTYITAPNAGGVKHSYCYYVELARGERDYEGEPEITPEPKTIEGLTIMSGFLVTLGFAALGDEP